MSRYFSLLKYNLLTILVISYQNSYSQLGISLQISQLDVFKIITIDSSFSAVSFESLSEQKTRTVAYPEIGIRYIKDHTIYYLGYTYFMYEFDLVTRLKSINQEHLIRDNRYMGKLNGHFINLLIGWTENIGRINFSIYGGCRFGKVYFKEDGSIRKQFDSSGRIIEEIHTTNIQPDIPLIGINCRSNLLFKFTPKINAGLIFDLGYNYEWQTGVKEAKYEQILPSSSESSKYSGIKRKDISFFYYPSIGINVNF